MVAWKLEKLVLGVITFPAPKNVYFAGEFTSFLPCVHKLQDGYIKPKPNAVVGATAYEGKSGCSADRKWRYTLSVKLSDFTV
jgi:hypothetical protein